MKHGIPTFDGGMGRRCTEANNGRCKMAVEEMWLSDFDVATDCSNTWE